MSLMIEARTNRSGTLATMLRERTADAHRAAERSPLFAAIVRGRIGAADYGAYLARLEPVYAALEDGLRRHRHHSIVERIYYPQLERREALRGDMAFFGIRGFPDRGSLPPAARLYAERVAEVSDVGPEMLVAHAYTRYLGDLSGGQIMAKKLHGAFALEGEGGFAFFAFPRVPNAEAFKLEYRAALDALPVTAEQADAIVAEAQRAFAYNRQLADEVWEGIAVRED